MIEYLKYIIVFYCINIMTSFGQKDTIYITGRICDFDSLTPIPYASVILNENEKAISNSNGEFIIKTINRNKLCSIEIGQIGYKPLIIVNLSIDTDTVNLRSILIFPEYRYSDDWAQEIIVTHWFKPYGWVLSRRSTKQFHRERENNMNQFYKSKLNNYVYIYNDHCYYLRFPECIIDLNKN